MGSLKYCIFIGQYRSGLSSCFWKAEHVSSNLTYPTMREPTRGLNSEVRNPHYIQQCTSGLSGWSWKPVRGACSILPWVRPPPTRLKRLLLIHRRVLNNRPKRRIKLLGYGVSRLTHLVLSQKSRGSRPFTLTNEIDNILSILAKKE